MTKPNLLICGDSFSADWRTEQPDSQGWPTLLEDHFNVNNLSMRGCSEYRIVKQLESANIQDYDYVVISHTSPYRLYTPNHPAYTNSTTHYHADFMYNDVEAHSKQYPELNCVKEYFETFFDLEHAEFVHRLTLKHISAILEEHIFVESLNIAHVDWSRLYQPTHMLLFSETWKQHRGNVNHYNDAGNRIVAQAILKHFYLN